MSRRTYFVVQSRWNGGDWVDFQIDRQTIEYRNEAEARAVAMDLTIESTAGWVRILKCEVVREVTTSYASHEDRRE